MDRNPYVGSIMRAVTVALRKESVDRNDIPDSKSLPTLVALRKESVDRNETGLDGIE